MVWAILNASITGLVVYLGFKLTVDAIQSTRQRQAYRVAFVILGVLGVCVAIGQELANSREQDLLRTEIHAMRSTSERTSADVASVKEQTRQPPTIHVPPSTVHVVQVPQLPTPPQRPNPPMNIQLIGSSILSVTSARVSRASPEGGATLLLIVENDGDIPTTADVTMSLNGKSSGAKSEIGVWPKKPSSIEMVLQPSSTWTLDKLNGTEVQLDLTYHDGYDADKRIAFRYRGVIVPDTDRLRTVEVRSTPVAPR